MGFYIRKSISVGPLRFNLSKSGIGVSSGIKGLRFGTGPRGNYVHMGVGGFYYRKTFPVASKKTQNSRIQEDYKDSTESSHEPFVDIDSGDIAQLFDSSSEELVQEINQKNKRVRFVPFVATFGLILLLLIYLKSSSLVLFYGTAIIVVIALYIGSLKDELRKSTVLFYDFEPEIEARFQRLHEMFEKMASANKIWHVEAQAIVTDQKRHAGASTLLKRKKISLSKKNPPFIKTNIEIPSIPVGDQTLYFFPDKLFVYEGDKVGVVSYSNLNITVEPTRFIESETVPFKDVNKSINQNIIDGQMKPMNDAIKGGVL